MSESICLNGSDWRLKDVYGEDWRWRVAHVGYFHAGSPELGEAVRAQARQALKVH